MRFISPLLKKTNNTATVALSMGADSLAVLHFLKTRYPKMNLKAVHFNHNLRGQNFDMAGKAIQFCSAYEIPLISRMRNAYSQRGTSEAELREYRLNSFSDLGYVITGHHLNDAVESYFMNCLRGTPEYLPIPLETDFTDKNFKLIRPFMLTTKADILKYIDDNNLNSWIVEDETNTDESMQRNWIRHNILPQISNRGYSLETIVRKKYQTKMLDLE